MYADAPAPYPRAPAMRAILMHRSSAIMEETETKAERGVEVGTAKHHNRNPTGRNQHPHCPRRNDATLLNALLDYHHRNITHAALICKLLETEYGIKCSPRTVTRRRADLGLAASGRTTKMLPDTVKRQLVLDQMSKDPERRKGPRYVQAAIARETGIHLTRGYITEEMRAQDPEGFYLRHPSHRIRFCGPGNRVIGGMTMPSPPTQKHCNRARNE